MQGSVIDNVAPIQYAIRLLIPAGSRLLDLREIQDLVEPYNQSALYYPWQHLDPVIDQLYERIFRLVLRSQKKEGSRAILFENIWHTILELAPDLESNYQNENIWDLAAKPVPRLSESWY